MSPPADSATRDFVLLMHGLAADRLVMYRLSRFLRRHGYEVLNRKYRSCFGSIERHADDLRVAIRPYEQRPEVGKIHIVGHSLGSIIARFALSQEVPQKFGKLVMLAPPNQGSHVARWLSSTLGRISGTLRQLSDEEGSFVRHMPEPEAIPIGIIAAEYDKVVPLTNTRLRRPHEFVSVKANHGPMPWSTATCEYVLEFLRTGKFAGQDVTTVGKHRGTENRETA